MAEFLVTFDPRSLSPEEYRKKFVEFLEEYELDQLQELLLINSGAEVHHSFTIHSPDLIHYDSALSYSVFHYPGLLLPIFTEAVIELQFTLYQHPGFVQKWGRKPQVKSNCHVRLVSIPSVCDLAKPTIGDVRSHEVNSLIQISGTVVRTGGVRMLELSKQYECMNPKCRYRFTVTADPEQDHMLPQPRSCPSKIDSSSSTAPRGNAQQGGRGGGASNKANKCNSVNLREIEGSRICVDYQEIKIQDHIERLGLGSVPRSIVVILQADLVDRFNPGDDVVVVGTMIRRWRPVVRGVRCSVEIAIEANSVVAVNAAEQVVSLSEATAAEFEIFWRAYRDANAEFLARNVIVKSVCPQLFGMFHVKLALLLSLVGGSSVDKVHSTATEHTTINNTTTDLTGDHSSNINNNTISEQQQQPKNYDIARGVQRRSHIHMLMVIHCCSVSQYIAYVSVYYYHNCV